MKPAAQRSPAAWQPFTPRGIAAFARARLGRLLGAQLVMALVAAGTSAWFVQTAWYPIITTAVARLPEQGEIRGGQLDWHGSAHQVLAENRFLALTVDLDHGGEVRSPANLAVEWGKHNVQIQSLLGFTRISYSPGWNVPWNRIELTPWWGAWRPPLLALLIVGVVIILVLSWAVLASLYFIPAWLVGFFANRDLSLPGSWRLSGAALMPGALLMSTFIVLYRCGLLDLIGLMIAAVAHIVLGWGMLLASVLRVERHPSTAILQSNPFAQANNPQPSSRNAVEPMRPNSQAGPPGQS